MYRHTTHLGHVIIIIGMQFGSEGKGAITEYLAPLASMGVRSGAANAGHTIYYGGRRYVMQQLPSVWINPHAQLVIGRGSLISLDILLREIATISKVTDLSGRVFVDRDAHVITQDHIKAEQQTRLAARIGSTSAVSGKGIGTAMAAKVLRSESCRIARDVPELQPYLADTVDMINTCLDQQGIVILEGTQGSGLSIDFGYFPYTTSRNVTAQALAASVGVSTHLCEVDVIGVTRTYPIRVAGTSGPFGSDSQEVSWDEVTTFAGSPQPIIERTTVTNNVRRVATFSTTDFLKACKVNRPTELALTFADYLDWSTYNSPKVSLPIEAFIDKIESQSGIPVTLVKNGPQSTIDFSHYRANMLRRIR